MNIRIDYYTGTGGSRRVAKQIAGYPESRWGRKPLISINTLLPADDFIAGGRTPLLWSLGINSFLSVVICIGIVIGIVEIETAARRSFLSGDGRYFVKPRDHKMLA